MGSEKADSLIEQYGADEDADSSEKSEAEEFEEENSPIVLLTIQLDTEETAKSLYEAITDCASLYPSPEALE